jgi:transposase
MSLRFIRLQDVRRLLRSAEEYELSAEQVQRLKWFQYALEHDGNVSLTCRHFGISRSTFLRWAERFDASDLRTFDEQSRRPHTVRAPETDAKTVELIRTIRLSSPTLGKEHIARHLSAEHGITISSSTVGRIIKRHGLFFGETASHSGKRAAISTDNESSAFSVRPVTPEPDISEDDPFLGLVPGVTS